MIIRQQHSDVIFMDEVTKWQGVFVWKAVIAWLESLFLVTRTRIESRWEKWWLDSSHVFLIMTRLESQSMTRDSSQGNFYKIYEFLMDKTSSFAHNEMSICASVMIKIVANFLFWVSSRAMLHFQDQVSLTCTEADLRLCFHWGVSGASYIDTLS